MTKARGNVEKRVITCLILHNAETGGGQDKESELLTNVCCLHQHVNLRKQCSLLETKAHLELNHRLHWTIVGRGNPPHPFPSLEYVEMAVECGHQLDSDQTSLSLQSKIKVQDLSLTECFSLALCGRTTL